MISPFSVAVAVAVPHPHLRTGVWLHCARITRTGRRPCSSDHAHPRPTGGPHPPISMHTPVFFGFFGGWWLFGGGCRGEFGGLGAWFLPPRCARWATALTAFGCYRWVFPGRWCFHSLLPSVSLQAELHSLPLAALRRTKYRTFRCPLVSFNYSTTP
jgi:hypothetical protein